MSVIINAAGLAITAWSIVDHLGSKTPDPEKDIQVSLFVGDAPNLGGRTGVPVGDSTPVKYKDYKEWQRRLTDGRAGPFLVSLLTLPLILHVLVYSFVSTDSITGVYLIDD
ncbi:hypothetical protein BDW59DRAFT_162347 [Aspergillus cavernicola]|uniref:Uncharacterized protein n=1 Tax=Aspergillus cavernicola TaxID=176166 RepID=A0ABR4IBW7_9EURO